MADYNIRVGIELDDSDLASKIRGIRPSENIRIGVELNDETVQRQINNIRQQIQDIGNIRINLGGNGNGGGRGGARRQVDETTQAYRELMGVLNELNSKRLKLNGLNASSPQSSNQIQRLRLQIEQLENEYNNLMNSFNTQGIQFTAQQWNQIETVMARVGRRIDVIQEGMSDKSAIREQTQAYKELLSISKEIGSLELNIAKLRGQGGNTNQISILESQLRTLQSTYQQLVTSMNTPLTAGQWSSIYTQIFQTSEKVEQLQAKVSDARVELAREIRIKLNDGTFDNDISNITSKFDKLTNKSNEIQIAMNDVNVALSGMRTAAANGDIEGLIQANQNYERSLKRVKNQLDINIRAERDAAAQQKLADDRTAFQSKIDAWLTKNSAATKRFGASMRELRAQAESCDRITLNNLQSQFNKLDKEAGEAGLKMQSLGDRIKTQFQKYSQYFSVASVIMWTTQGMKDMFQQVVSIDTAMTELRKVTDETDASYNKFLSNAASRAKEIGTTIDGLVSSTADFARLGYSFEQSQGLAEVANIYTVVGDDIEGVEGATQSLISTLAAFKHEMNGMSDSDFAMSIVDKFNEVSNNFAISSGGIGEALTRSASSLAAANNTLDESIALITAANEVTQNPEKVGNAFKTISMRIRGAKSELEEAGESTDGMVDSTAKLREEIMALSGVDIMQDANTFKSTYAIMDELSAKWENLSDIAQATIIELIAGKHQGNVFSSLMANFDTAREALETSATSSGSAMAEHAKWSDSLEARLLKLKATWQSLSQSFMNSSFLKGGISAITGLVDGVDALISKFGTLPTLLTAFTAFKSFSGKGFFRVIEDEAALSGQRIATIFSTSTASVAQQFNDMGIKSNAQFKKSFEFDITSLRNYRDAVNGGMSVTDAFAHCMANASEAAQTYAKTHEINGKAILEFGKQQKAAQVTMTAQNKSFSSAKAIMQEYNSGCKNTAMSQKDFITAVSAGNSGLGKYLSGLNGAKAGLGGYIASLAGTTAATFALEVATMALNAALTMGISALISWGIKALDEWIVTADELAEKVDEVTTKYKEQHKALMDIKGDYDTTNENSMISKYAELSKGVDGLGRNLSLTADEYSEYQSIVNTIAGQIPSLVSGYDSQGNAILSCAGNVEQLTAAYKELIHAQNNEILSKAGDINKDFSNAVKDSEHNTKGWFGLNWTKELNLGSSKLSTESAKIYENILNSKDAISEFNKIFDSSKQPLTNELRTDLDAMADLLETAGFEKKEGFLGLDLESDEEYVRRAFKENRDVVKRVLDQHYAELETEIEGKKTLAQAALSEALDVNDFMYSNMSDTMKNIAQQTVSGFDFEFFADLEKKDINVEDYVNTMLDQLNSLSKNDNAAIETAFNLKTQFNGGDISYGEYVDGLEGAGKLVGDLVKEGKLDKEVGTQIKLSLGLNEDGLVENYKTLTKRLEKVGLGKSDAEGLLNDLSSKELSVLTQIIPEIDANATREQIEAAIDREMVLSGLVFDLNLEVEAAGVESLNTALSESVTASGLSSESIAALKGRYAELESQGWDLSSMFEETSHGIHLNRNELSKFENELSKQKLDKVNGDLDRMKSEYDKLGEAIKNATGAEKAELFNERQSLAQKISEAATLASQYQGLTSAYNDWLAAESAGNERDMYENVLSGFETVKDELSRGWADDGTVEFLELLTGKTDLAGKSGNELKEIYNSLDDTIKNTTHSVRDFFTVDKEGNSTSKGVYNFLDAVGQLEEEAFGGKDVVKRNSKGNIIGFDFNLVGGDEAIAEALGVSEELVQIMVRAADDAGFVISMDGTYKQLADLQNEAKAAADYLKEIGKTDFDFDFNTSSATNIKDQLVEANKVLDTFKDKDGNINLNADGAVEAMQVVSTLQAKLDTITQEKYGIGLTVEDDKYEDALESLQNYGRTIATLNQLEINPNANAEEIKKLEADLNTYATELNNLPDDVKVEIGLVGEDGKTPLNNVDAIKKKAESGEIKIPTTLDIQANMDKNIEDLRDLMLLNVLDEESAEAKRIRIKFGLEAEVTNPEAVDEAVDNAVNTDDKETENTTVTTDVEIKAGEIDTSNVDKTIKNEVETGAEGQKNYRIGISPDVKVDPEVDTSGAEKKIEEKTKEAVESQSGKATTLEQDVQLEFNINDYVDELSQFKDVAKELDGLDDVNVKINASLDGELNSDDIDKLGKFAEGAKALQGVKSSDVSVDVDFDGNLNNTEGLDKLIEFANGAKALQGVKSSDVSVNVELECEFNGGNLDSLAKFVDSASKIEGVKSSDVSVSVELDGNLNEYKGKLENIGVFADNAKKLVGVKDANVSIKVALESEFNETNLDDLTKFVNNADKLKGIKDSDVSIAANLNGNLNNNTNLDNLETFVTRAKDLQSVESKEVNILANLNGNLNNNTNIDNLESFAKNASMLSDAESKEINITANLNGNLNNNTNIDNLEEFAKRAESLQGLEDTKVNITANLNGNLNNNTNIDNLREFANRAADLQGLEDTKVNITANLNGNLNNNTNIDNLEQFADRAEDLQGLKDVAINITANLNGNLNNNTNIDNLEEFADRAEDLQGMKDVAINITANLNGNLNNNTNIDNLEQFADKAKDLQGLEDTKVNISANLNGNLSNNTNIDNLEAFSDAAKDLQSVGNVSVSVKVNVDSASINSAIEVLSDVADSGVFKDYNASITVQTVGVDKVNNLKTTLSNIKNKTIKILVKGAEAALKAIKSVASALKGIDDNKTIKIKAKGNSKSGGSQEKPKDETAKVNYEKGTQEEPDDKTALVNYSLGTQESPVDKEALVNYKKGSQEPPANMTALVYYKRAGGGGAPAAGTAHSDGTTGSAFARGYWGIGNNGVALGGELGQELVVRDGHFFTIGDKGAEFFRYKKNDIVFNATQTRALFRYGGIRGANPRGKMLATGSAFAQGNAFAQGRAFSGGGGGGMESTTVVVGKNPVTGKEYTRQEGEGAEDFQETMDFIEIAIERIERTIERIDRTVNNIYKSWADRNGALMDELSEIAEAIKAQQQAYEKYMEAAEGVGLDEEWIEKIENGSISIETITDEALKQQIDDYKEYYEAAQDALDAIEELKETEAELNAQRVENAKKEYDGILGVIEHEKNMLDEYINQSEEQAWLVSAEYYNALANNERENIIKLQEQKAAMIEAMGEAMASGTIAEGSEGYYEMVSSIDEVTLAIEEANTQLLEYAQTLQQLEWEVFDLLQEKISSVVEETEFLIDLMSNKKLYDDNGQLTDEGSATMGLHGVAYNTYMHQADQAAAEIEKLKKELESDPYDTELEERYREMIALQQDYILNAEDEKDAIRSLVEEGIQLEIEALQERIDKYNESLESAKDLYEYNKKVKEQTEEIASLEKQLSAYDDDDSEETRAKVQQIKVDLESARAELEETEYDKYIDDTEKLLDNLLIEYEEFYNARLDNIDALIADMIAEINADSSIISDTIHEAANSVGYTLTDSMQNIWNEEALKTQTVITTYGDKFVNAQTTTNNVLTAINTNLQNMIAELNKKATTNIKTASTSSVSKSSNTNTNKTPSTNNNTTNKPSGSRLPQIGDRVKYVNGQYYYDSQGKKPLGSQNQGEYVYITNINNRDWATHGYHISTGNKLGKGDLGWLKLSQISGYETGTKKVLSDELAWTQENGTEFIIRPSDGAILTPVSRNDKVFSASASNNLWSMANSPAEFIKDNLNLGTASVPNNSTVQSNYTQNLDKVIFNLPNVQNYNEFLSALRDDKNFERLIQSITIDQIAGGSSLAKGKSIR